MRKISKRLAIFTAIGMMALTGCQGKTKEVVYDYVASDYVTVNEYKNISVDVSEFTVTDDDITNAVNQILEKNMEYKPTDRAAQDGDMVVVDFDAFISGGKVEGFSGDDFQVFIGTDTFLVDGFEKALVGLKTGEKRAITDLFVPEDFTIEEKYAGKAITYNIEILSVNEPVLPEYNDDFVDRFTDGSFKSVADYNAEIRRMLDENAVTNRYNAKYNGIFEQIISKTDVKKDFPAEYVEKKKANVEDEIKKFAVLYNLTDSQYLMKYFGKETVEEVVNEQILTELIYQYIIETENITISEKYYKDHLQETAEKRGYTSADKFVSTNGENTVLQCMQLDKAIDLIMDSAVEVVK